jgi:site-specific DNA-methyltransferase (adenine-specific)
MNIYSIEAANLHVADNRQRREFKPEQIVELSDSIARNGLIQPLVVRLRGEGGTTLVAGERRKRAIEYCWNIGNVVKCGETVYPEGIFPCLFLGDLDPIDAMEIELEENIRRVDLTWQESAAATSQLFELRRLQALKAGLPEPKVKDIAKELRPEGNETAAETFTREQLIVSRHLDNPEISGAKSAKEALKLLKRQEQTQRNIELGEKVGLTFTAAVHRLYQGDCFELMSGGCEEDQFDVILTDPPYGINAQDFNDSGGRTVGGHGYDDTPENLLDLTLRCAELFWTLAKPQAHLYWFCDIDYFVIIKKAFECRGWKVFRTPIIWHNPTSMRAPWPEHGPQRKWQMCLFAIKGDKHVNVLAPDLVEYRSDENLGHPAQKPVALFIDLLKRSVQPGDVVFDPFAGSGTIFPAAHSLKCKAVGIELDAAAYGIAVKRLGELK